ncbi:hypothetical protein [Pedobacter sp. Hv1]|uniref:hypothetical protein n=1 Tax=Pedobacter sp. Hv1 TaxID=1740090 RepID=UPI000A4D7662|nr:hypothetical protein [Pedobacter sp. Hv1]
MCNLNISLEDISNTISICTPFILLIWFYYSQKQSLSKIYYNQIDGIYAGYTIPTTPEEGRFTKAGMIFNVRDTDDNGYFKGELEYVEIRHWTNNHQIYSERIIEAQYMFLGNVRFELSLDKTRHPFKQGENRVYTGILSIVDRLDFQFEEFKIEDYSSAEYKITHFREMQVMKFELIKKHRPEFALLPNSFTLYKSIGFDFEPYTSVKSDLFPNLS